jgi:UBX domain.
VFLCTALFQGTFSVYEKLEAVNKFLRENLLNEDLPFILTTPVGHQLSDEDGDKTLTDLRLVPAAILTFSWDFSIAEEGFQEQQPVYLKPEILMLMQSL